MLELPLYYMGPVSYYSQIFRAITSGEGFRFDPNDRWEKQTLRSRCYIAGPQGRMMLTVPVSRTPSGLTVTSPLGGRNTLVGLSDHGNWRHQHWNALVSSYKQSPFFDYYADAFAPHYQPGAHSTLASLCGALHEVIMEALEIDRVVEVAPMRTEREYYQVFKGRTGFLEDLSVVDLLFNEGPSARLWL